MEFKAMNRTSITEEIIEHIKDLIRSQELKDGDQLPTEEQMAEQMGVGRGTIRESLRVLIHLGLIERNRKRTMVAPLAYEKLQNKEVFKKIDSHRDVMEMMELRKVIEPEAAGLAAERADHDEISQMAEVYQHMVETEGDIQVFVTHDTKFHLLIMKAAGNNLFMEIMNNIQQLLRKNQLLVAKERAHIMPRSIEFHGKILTAIRARNKGLAKRQMLNHMLDVEKEMYQLFKEAD